MALQELIPSVPFKNYSSNSDAVSPTSVVGCCFVTYYSRKSALEAQNALHNMKILPGVGGLLLNCLSTHGDPCPACWTTTLQLWWKTDPSTITIKTPDG